MLSVPEVKKLLKQGLNDGEIGDKLGYSKYQIHRFRKANNIPSSHVYRSNSKVKEINKLRDKCKNQAELAKKVNLSRNRVSEIIKANNIEYIKKPNKLRIRKFGTWTIIRRTDDDSYECRCDCGNEKVFAQSEIKYNSTRCSKCKMKNPFRIRQKMFLADYKRAEKIKQKDLLKRGKSYIINSVNNIDELGRDTYVNLLCPKGHQTKNKFNNYDGCKVCK